MDSLHTRLDKFVEVGLLWEEVEGKTIDLDLQCVLLNDLGQIEDAVYYNQVESKLGNIKHSGDSLGEKNGFDELINMDLSSLSFQIKYIAIIICSYKGEPLTSVESCWVKVNTSNNCIEENGSKEKKLIEGKLVYELAIGSLKQQGYSVLACILEKSPEGIWNLARLSEVGNGKSFVESEALIKKGLVKGVGFDEVLFQECKSWNGGKSFKLTKNQSLLIPPNLTKIAFGLGWESHCDIDASVLLFGEKGNCIENIYFGNKTSSNGSVRHSGDNLTGAGSGDDEVLTIQLDQVPKEITTIWTSITIFTSGMQFDDVTGAYCRLFCAPGNANSALTGNEFCKYNLSENLDNISTGCIMCSISRCKDGCWSVSPKGYFTTGTKTSANISPILSKVITNNFSDVKTIEQIYIEKPHLGAAAALKAEKAARELAEREEMQRRRQLEAEEEQRRREELRPKQMEFTLKSASDLGAFDSNGFSDPYVGIYLNNKKIGKSAVIKKTLNPEWNYSIHCSIAPGDLLTLKLWDRDSVFDEFMGCCSHTFTAPIKSHALKLDVHDKDGKNHPKFKGTVFAQLTQLN